MGQIVYFSSATNNTKRFVVKLGMPARRIPLRPTEEPLHVEEEYVLIVPTYGGGGDGGGRRLDPVRTEPRPVVAVGEDHGCGLVAQRLDGLQSLSVLSQVDFVVSEPCLVQGPLRRIALNA